ncbi:MAG: hypothetical protein D6704_13280 [Nitrospirae bacterium]|nr:MAG: hypothetical protein D6704_13280 [Nitrospirota bacterium]
MNKWEYGETQGMVRYEKDSLSAGVKEKSVCGLIDKPEKDSAMRFQQGKPSNSNVTWLLRAAMLLAILLSGCLAEWPHEVDPSSPRSAEWQHLAGVWEYREGGRSYRLVVDEHGRGFYSWNQGQLETVSLNHGQWRGLWFQRGNDREGEFVIHLSPDGRTGEGRWWYTRIGSDHDPLYPGGTFTISRLEKRP